MNFKSQTHHNQIYVCQFNITILRGNLKFQLLVFPYSHLWAHGSCHAIYRVSFVYHKAAVLGDTIKGTTSTRILWHRQEVRYSCN